MDRIRHEPRGPETITRAMAEKTDESSEELQESHEEVETNPDVDMEYLERWATKFFALQYGTLPNDHPAQQAVVTALRRCRKDIGNAPRIMVLPEWKEINAVAIGTNTIAVSMGLLQFCRTYEGLMGVLGHERRHLEHQDAVKSIARRRKRYRPSPIIPTPKSFAHEYVDEMGAKRMAEIGADIKGATIDLDAAGINPLGYREFLHDLDLHVRQETKGKFSPDIAHGTPVDRALAIGFLLKYFDFSTSAHDLSPIDVATKETRNTFAHAPSAWTFRSTMDAGPTDTERDRANAERIAWFDTLSFEEQLFCAGTVNAVTFARGNLQEKRRRDEWFTHISTTIDAELDQRLAHATDEIRATARQLLHVLVLDQRSDGVINTGIEALIKMIDAGGGTAHYTHAMQELLPHVGPYTFGNPALFILYWAGRYPADATEEQHDAWMAEVEELARTTAQFFEGRSAERIRMEDLLLKTLYAARTRALTLGEEGREVWILEELHKRGVSEGEQRKSESKTRAEIMLKADRNGNTELGRLEDEFLKNPRTCIDGYIDAVHTLSRGEAPDVVYEIFIQGLGRANQSISLASAVHSEKTQKTKITLRSFELKEIRLKAYNFEQFCSTFKHVLDSHPAFVSLAPIERRLLFYNFLTEASAYSPQEQHFDPDNPDEIKEDAIKMELRHMQRDIIIALADADDSIAMRLTKKLWEHRPQSSVSFDHHFPMLVRDLSFRLSETPPERFFARFDAFVEAGCRPDELLQHARTAQGRLVRHLMIHMDAFTERGEDVRALQLVANLSTDGWVGQAMRRAAAQRAWERAPDFSTRLAVAFDTDHASITLADRVIEQEMTEHEHVAEVRKVAQREIDDMFNESSRVGWIALSEIVDIKKRKPLEMLSVLLSTGANDRRIKDLIAADIFVGYGGQAMGRDFTVKSEFERMITQRISAADSALASLYSLDKPTRLYIVKRLLVDGDVLRDKKTRGECLELLLTHVLAEQKDDTDPELRRWVQETVRALADVDDWETVFYAIGPILADRICIPPEHPVRWTDIWDIESHIMGLGTVNNFPHAGMLVACLPTTNTQPLRHSFRRNVDRQNTAIEKCWMRCSMS